MLPSTATADLEARYFVARAASQLAYFILDQEVEGLLLRILLICQTELRFQLVDDGLERFDSSILGFNRHHVVFEGACIL